MQKSRICTRGRATAISITGWLHCAGRHHPARRPPLAVEDPASRRPRHRWRSREALPPRRGAAAASDSAGRQTCVCAPGPPLSRYAQRSRPVFSRGLSAEFDGSLMAEAHVRFEVSNVDGVIAVVVRGVVNVR